ncbi:hypothetical protein HYV71_04165 [Candidatus Uhrbacteria bacterium]|nr:hypothetical protein [Candidatus Uhrbacteria bacterium]
MISRFFQISLFAFFCFVFFIAITAFSPFVHTAIKTVHAAGEQSSALIGGWAWNQTLGWVSQRHIIRDPDTQDRIGEFGVVKYEGEKDAKGKPLPDEIEGWSWSSVYGFICWGRTCSTLCTVEEKKAGKCPSPSEVRALSGSIVPPGGGTSYARISKEKEDVLIGSETQKFFKVEGWAKILQLRDRGWIQLNGCSVITAGGAQCPSDKKFGLHFDDFTNEFRGWAWNTVVGWFAFSGKTLYDTQYSYACYPKANGQCDSKKERFEIRVHPVTGQPVVFLPNEQISIPAAQARGLKIILDSSACLNQKLCEDVGFIEKIGKSPWRTQYVGPRIETSGGAAFARKGFDLSDIDFADEAFTGEFIDEKSKKKLRGKIIGSTRLEKTRRDKQKKSPGKKPPKNDPGGGQDFDGREGALRVEFPVPSKDKTKLVSQLGFVHTLALITRSGIEGVKNKYGYDVVQLDPNFQASTSKRLKGKIYLYKPAASAPDQEIAIGSPTDRAQHTIMNSLSANESGAGTIVAYGANIHIYAPIRYADTALTAASLRQLASVAWIALKDEKGNGGNIIIDNCIPPTLRPDNKGYLTSVPMDGLYVAEGTITTGSGDGKNCIKIIDATPGLDAAKKTAYKDAFRSSISEIDIPISVEGAMIAKQFSFERTYGGYDQGSEDIVDTGRHYINPPPGIADIVRSLPVR